MMAVSLAALAAIVVLATQPLWAAGDRKEGERAIGVNVIQVQASNKGEAFVDPALGELGKRLKAKYPYKSFKKVGAQTSRGTVGGTIEFPLMGGMSLSLELQSATHDVLTTKATVMRAAEEILKTSLRVRYNAPVIISVPLGDDLLILAITPSGGGGD
jgi:hypothetical protein